MLNFKDWLLTEGPISFQNLQNTYDFNRGRWKEVEQAAQKNPKLAAYLQRLQQGVDVKDQGRVFQTIEKATRATNPDHGHGRPVQQPATNVQQPTKPGMTQPQYRVPLQDPPEYQIHHQLIYLHYKFYRNTLNFYL